MKDEHQQPKEHCDHECVCGVLMVGGTEGDRSPCDFSGCQHDTRSRPHPAPAQGTSKLCFGTQHPASECCQQCNELETCKQKQRYLDYDKKEAASKAREDVLDKVIAWKRKHGYWFTVNAISGEKRYHFEPDRFEEFIKSLRSTQQQAGDQHE